MPRRFLVTAALAVALTACSGPAEPDRAAPVAAPTEPQVLAISIDGLNVEAITQLGADAAPTLHRLIDEGPWRRATGRASRWARGAPTRRRRSRRRVRRTSPASRPARTSPPGSGTACRRPGPARTASRCCTTPSPTRSARRSTRSARAPRCWSTPTTSRRRSGSRSTVAGTSLGAVRLDSGDLAVLAVAGARPARLARRDRDADHRDQRPRRVRDRGRWPRRRSTGTASAPSSSPAAGTRPAASSTSWSRASPRPASSCRSRSGASTRSRSAGASTRCAGGRPPGSPRPR